MTKGREYLDSMRELSAELEAIRQQISYLYNVSTDAGCDSPAAGADQADENAARIQDLIADRERVLSQWLDAYEMVTGILDRIPEQKFRIVLSLRYLLRYSWDAVSEETGYQIRHLLRIHNKAIAQFDEILSRNDCQMK